MCQMHGRFLGLRYRKYYRLAFSYTDLVKWSALSAHDFGLGRARIEVAQICKLAAAFDGWRVWLWCRAIAVFCD